MVCFYCGRNSSKLDFEIVEVVSLSSIEIEYVVATEASKEIV